MENRSHALMTGFFTIALLVAAILIGLWLNRDRTETHPYEIVTTQTIPGLNPQAAVRYRGLEVGRVDEIVFDPRATGQILIRLSIDEGSPITTTTFATLGYQGVTGIAFIQLDDKGANSPLLASDKGNVRRIPLRPGLIDQLETRGLAILEKTEHITNTLDTVINKENADKITGAVDNISKVASAFGAIPDQISPALARLPALETKFDQTLRSIDRFTTSATATSENYNRLANSLQAPDGPIAHAAAAIDSVGGVTSDLELHTLPHVVEMTDEAKTSLRAVRRTVTNLGERPQSILFGAPTAEPGPGEPGFTPPTK